MVKLKALGKREKKRMGDAPIRRCTDDCFFFKNDGKGCQYYQDKHVVTNDPCMYDLVKMKAYADAYNTGDLTVIKDDASAITAQVMILAQNMLQEVAIVGSAIEEPLLDAKGAVVYVPDPNFEGAPGEHAPMVPLMRIREHPLISRATQMLKSIGVNLSEFKLTPKSADEKTAVSGHIIIGEEREELKVILEKRLLVEDKFAKAVEVGNTRTINDPVFQALLEAGDIIE